MSTQATPQVPGFLASVGTIFRMQVRRLIRGKKLRLALVATGLIVFAVVAARYAATGSSDGLDPGLAAVQAEEAVGQGLRWGFFNLLVFLLPFLFTSSAIAEEVEGRTMVYLVGRPVGRVAIAIGKWAAGTALAVGIIVAMVFVLHLTAYATEPTALVEAFPSTLRAAGALALLTTAYSSLCMFFGASTPGAAGVAVALYLGIVEFLFSFMPGIFRCVSINYSAQQLAGLEKAGLMVESAPDISVAIAIAALSCFILTFLGLAALVVQFSEYRFSQA